jgi:hypothetical protein
MKTSNGDESLIDIWSAVTLHYIKVFYMFLMGTADTTGGNIQHPTTFQMIHMDR